MREIQKGSTLVVPFCFNGDDVPCDEQEGIRLIRLAEEKGDN